MKKNWKRFFTLSRAAEGFTLVELIVVIAILAILAGVAVPAYSGYITKTNMQADMTLISDIEYALHLAIYNDMDHTLDESAMVIVSTSGARIEAGSDADQEFLNNAMEMAFGSQWQDVCKLKYSGWAGGVAETVEKYTASNYYNNEEALLGRVSGLTGAMASCGLLDNVDSKEYNALLAKYNVDATDPTQAGNAAVVYVADAVSNLKSTQVTEIETALKELPANYMEYGDVSATVDSIVGTLTGGNTTEAEAADSTDLLTAYALIYAYMEGYSAYIDKNVEGANTETILINGIEDFGKTGESAIQKMNTLSSLFKQVYEESLKDGGTAAEKYFYGSDAAANDITGIFAVLDAVSQSGDAISQNFASADCYSDGTVSDMLNAYISMGVYEIADGEGAVVINVNKSLVAYLGSILS